MENRNWGYRIIERAEFMKYKTRILVVAAIMSCAMCTVAFAGTAVSKEKNFKVNGDTYTNTATIDAYPELAQGTIWVSGKKLPAGYYGVSAAIVKDNQVIEITGTGYTDRETTGLGKYTSPSRNGIVGSTYFAYGTTEVFDGERYIKEYTHNSPNQVVSRNRTGIEAQKNQDNQFDFESAVKNNEMIPAIGVDGVEGFIYPADYIDNGIKTPEQALAKQRQRNGNSEYINLYAEDGKTVIGKMEVTYGGAIMK